MSERQAVFCNCLVKCLLNVVKNNVSDAKQNKKKIQIQCSCVGAEKATREQLVGNKGIKNRLKGKQEERCTENMKKEGADKLFWLQTADRKPKIRWRHLLCTQSAATLLQNTK